MMLSRSADYGLRAMIYLAARPTADYVPLQQITQTMRTPHFLLAHILQRLVKGGLIASMKGHHGGFRLQRAPNEITVADIIEQIDGPVRAFDCTGDADCALAGDCSLLDVFARVENAVRDTLQAATLEEVARPYIEQLGGSKAAVVNFQPGRTGALAPQRISTTFRAVECPASSMTKK